MAKVDYSAVGRRKKAVARVRLVAGDGKVVPSTSVISTTTSVWRPSR